MNYITYQQTYLAQMLMGADGNTYEALEPDTYLKLHSDDLGDRNTRGTTDALLTLVQNADPRLQFIHTASPVVDLLFPGLQEIAFAHASVGCRVRINEEAIALYPWAKCPGVHKYGWVALQNEVGVFRKQWIMKPNQLVFSLWAPVQGAYVYLEPDVTGDIAWMPVAFPPVIGPT